MDDIKVPNPLEFTVKIKPVSVNSAYYKRNMSLTKEARGCRNSFHTQLYEYKSQFETFNSNLSLILRQGYGIKLEITHFVPEKLFYTKEGNISRRSGDTSNYTKVLQDFLFNMRLVGRKTLNDTDYQLVLCDDQYITENHDKMVPTDGLKWTIKFKVSLYKPSVA